MKTCSRIHSTHIPFILQHGTHSFYSSFQEIVRSIKLLIYLRKGLKYNWVLLIFVVVCLMMIAHLRSQFTRICIYHWAEVCEWWAEGWGGLEVSNGKEQWEGSLIISFAAPAISTYGTDRAKHQLMQRYPHGIPACSHLDSAAAFWLQ